ncbi:stage VI sporulation protein D [Neobacillus sp. DY30]|uniref:stage VI sporulation protein D n=1 Tax=Neobacillus sp. DY30 TaxID=3047871 RepID=UPI0024C091B3|nr:stage VI sporulation protein D [Neobacillus sp. DY30]WHX99500.1 stage VI sporulation protein D [Neobacillus sp. DY30]
MSQENQSCLRFSLEESLWFRKGQEVTELVSISLDPDITIQENDQYVTIRGSLELTGEYRNDEESTVEEEEYVPNQKYVERVDPQEEGICEFSHRFPVDITIPNNRIQSIYDIDVIVESFDYSIPERSCLKLSAELTISGLYDSTQQEDEAVEEEQFEVLHRYQVEVPREEELEEAEQEENQFEDTFLFEAEARKQPEEEKIEAFPKFPTFTYEEPEEEEEPKLPEQPIVYEHARSEANEQIQKIEEIVEEAPAQPIAEQEVKEPVEAKEPVLEESSSSPEAPPKQAKKKAGKKKTMTLTEFFARKEDSSDQARLKVCIVQKGDTLDGIADRYHVSVPNLLRYNNLELNQDVFEGQVLYVPAALAKK